MAKRPKAAAKAKTVKKPGDRRGAPKGRFKNPPFKPTDHQRKRVIELIAGSPGNPGGAQHWIIAEDLGISLNTLERHFRKELDTGTDIALTKIGGSMMGKALDPAHKDHHDASKFVLARRAGWKTTTAVESSGPGGGPIVYVNEPPRRDLSHLTEDEKIELERLTAKLEMPVERPADE